MAFSMPTFTEAKSETNKSGEDFKKLLKSTSSESQKQIVDTQSSVEKRDTSRNKNYKQRRLPKLRNCSVQYDLNIKLETIYEAEVEETSRIRAETEDKNNQDRPIEEAKLHEINNLEFR